MPDLSKINWGQYVQNNPDVLADFLSNHNGTHPGDKYSSINDFGLYHYNTFGRNEGRDLSAIDPDAIAAKAAADNKATQDAAAATALTKHTADVGTAQGIATRSADDIVRQWGLDPTVYSSRIAGAIGDKSAAIGDTDNPYNALDGSQIASQLLNTDQTTNRNALTTQANQKFGANYGNNLISSHLLDDAVTSTLGIQKTAAQDYLDRGKARGIYSDTGYSAGQNALGQQASAASSKVGSLADSVLDSYRAKANTVRDNAYSAAGSATLGSPINLDDYVKQGNDVLGQATSRGAGDLASAIGATQYYDFSGLTNAAGAAQGTGNFRDSSITGALAERNKQRMASRGLGSQGVF